MNLCTTVGVKLYVAINTFIWVLVTTLYRFLFLWGITILVRNRLIFQLSFIKYLIRFFALQIIFMQCAPLCYFFHDNVNISIVENPPSPFPIVLISYSVHLLMTCSIIVLYYFYGLQYVYLCMLS